MTSLSHTSLSGLIPAHAGSTILAGLMDKALRAHPRSRGEHAIVEGDDFSGAGSSPLTRGALGSTSRDEHQQGLIPAHAGSTAVGVDECGVFGAHPRSRGEHLGSYDNEELLGGSSPLTRGARLGHARIPCLSGLIPAHAGSTSAFVFGHVCEWAHPRSRGEHHGLNLRVFSYVGSSPLTRGALNQR